MMNKDGSDLLIRQLKEIRFFANLDKDDLAILASHTKQIHLEAEQTLFTEGEQGEGLYWLQSGWLKAVKYSSSGREQTLHFIEAKNTFNEVGAFTKTPNVATLICLEPSEILLIPKQTLQTIIRNNPDFAQHIIEIMAQRLQHLVTLVEDLSLRSVTNRLARLIVEGQENHVLQRPKWYTQNELAARLGTVTDVIQRSLRELEAKNLIKVERDKIHILDLEVLENLAE